MDTVYLFDRVFCTENLLFFNPKAAQSLGAVDKRHNSVPTSYVEALLGIRDMPEGTLRLLASSIGLDLGHWPSTLQGAQFRIHVAGLRRAVILQVTSSCCNLPPTIDFCSEPFPRQSWFVKVGIVV